MASNSINFSVRMNDDIKKESEMVFSELGVNLTTAINVFLRKSIAVGGFPFDVRIDQPNKETRAALREAEALAKNPDTKRYTDVEELLKELKA